MKKKKNKINIQMIPTPSRILNISSITKNESNINNINIINKETINTENSDKNRSKSNNAIKINKNYIPQKRLNTIDIIDKKIDIIYDWNILLNSKNRGIYYKKSDYKKLLINDFETDKNDNTTKKSLVLLDIPESQIKKYFGKKSFLKFTHPKTAKTRHKSKQEINKDNNNDTESNKLYNNLKPISINSPRDPHQPFYFSNEFSNYYKYDFKQYTQMIPNLKVKVKTSNKKLLKEIINLQIKSDKDSINLKNFFDNDEKIFKVQDLIIAGKRNNPARLMKNLYMLKHPNYQKVKQDKRMYFKTMKPIGEYFGDIDYTKNERWRTYFEIKRLRKNDKKFFTLENNKNSNYKTNLTLSYYKANDPHIKYFNKIVKKYNRLNKENSNEDNELLYTKGFSYNKKNKKFNAFFRDKLIKVENDNKNQKQKDEKNYKNYFITETTKHSNNE